MRYIDADNFRKAMIKRFGCIPCLTDYSEASRYDIPIDDALNLEPTADVVPKSEVEKLKIEIEALKIANEKMYAANKEQEAKIDTLQGVKSEYEKFIGGLKPRIDNVKAEVARAFRQRMNEKMGKHTHLLGKEYVQRIMREIEKEFTESGNDK